MKPGDKVRIIKGSLYLGKWLLAGSEGVIESQASGGHSWWVKIGDACYVLAPAEFEVIGGKIEKKSKYNSNRY